MNAGKARRFEINSNVKIDPKQIQKNLRRIESSTGQPRSGLAVEFDLIARINRSLGNFVAFSRRVAEFLRTVP